MSSNNNHPIKTKGSGRTILARENTVVLLEIQLMKLDNLRNNIKNAIKKIMKYSGEKKVDSPILWI